MRETRLSADTLKSPSILHSIFSPARRRKRTSTSRLIRDRLPIQIHRRKSMSVAAPVHHWQRENTPLRNRILIGKTAQQISPARMRSAALSLEASRTDLVGWHFHRKPIWHMMHPGERFLAQCISFGRHPSLLLPSMMSLHLLPSSLHLPSTPPLLVMVIVRLCWKITSLVFLSTRKETMTGALDGWTSP